MISKVVHSVLYTIKTGRSQLLPCVEKVGIAFQKFLFSFRDDINDSSSEWNMLDSLLTGIVLEW